MTRCFAHWCRQFLLTAILTGYLVPTGPVQSSELPAGELDFGQISRTITEIPLPGLEAIAYLPEIVSLEVHLVVKLSARRVYLYREGVAIASYPVAIGKPGWETPLGTFRVLSKEVNPVFKSFKTGTVIPPGPDNPLGVRWIGIWTDGKTQLGFHGTNEAELIGQAVSHGCIRMRNADVVALYDQVQVGTIVMVQP